MAHIDRLYAYVSNFSTLLLSGTSIDVCESEIYNIAGVFMPCMLDVHNNSIESRIEAHAHTKPYRFNAALSHPLAFARNHWAKIPIKSPLHVRSTIRITPHQDFYSFHHLLLVYFGLSYVCVRPCVRACVWQASHFEHMWMCVYISPSVRWHNRNNHPIVNVVDLTNVPFDFQFICKGCSTRNPAAVDEHDAMMMWVDKKSQRTHELKHWMD